MNDKKKSNLKIIIGVLLILCIILIGAFVWYNKTKQENTKVTLGKIELICINEINEPIIGEKISLKDEEGKILGEVESGTDGKVMFYTVPIGNYNLEVVQNVEGYEPEEKVKKVTVSGGEQATVTFKNNWQYGQLNVTVLDDANKPIANNTIEVYDEEGRILKTLKTNEEGKGIANLNNGTYYFKQINEDNKHTIDETLYKCTVDEENKTFYQNIVNERYKGNVLLVVTDQNQGPVEGVEYELLDSNKESITTITTNEKGLAGAKNLPLGTYYYKEKNEIYDKEMHELKIEEKDQIVRKDISINK